jgi:DNA polymerase III sliding clamp (beta) subunit (PCNA family)
VQNEHLGAVYHELGTGSGLFLIASLIVQSWKPSLLYNVGPDTAAQLSVVMIEGKFPEYSAITRKSFSVRTTMDRAGFTQQLKIARLFAKDSANNVQLSVAPKVLTVRTTSPEAGGHVGEMDIEARNGKEPGTDTQYDGKPLVEIGLNTNCLTAVLGVIPSPKIVLETKRQQPARGGPRNSGRRR